METSWVGIAVSTTAKFCFDGRGYHHTILLCRSCKDIIDDISVCCVRSVIDPARYA